MIIKTHDSKNNYLVTRIDDLNLHYISIIVQTIRLLIFTFCFGIDAGQDQYYEANAIRKD